MLPSFCRDTIIRIRPGTREERGSTIPDWTDAEEIAISGCSMQPAATSLSQDGRVAGITDGFTAYVPKSADIRAGDRIAFKGKIYAINGDPREWPSATGALEHIQLNLTRWTG